ncbi:MAG: hypothetical protein ACFFAY_08200, partial [Promethearchaeota archaeon]
MNRRPIILALVLSLFVVNMGFSASKDAARYMAEPERATTPIKAQAIQNISSYLDFSLAASSVLADNLVNADTGRIYHEGDFEWNYFTNGSTLTDYYWAISALERAYNVTGNATYFSMIGKMATMMVTLFMDPVYPGFYIDTWSPEILTQTKRAGIQAYAYKALVIAESVDSELDFTVEKQSAITCLSDMLYDSENGGFHFFTMRNGSLNIPEYIYEVYPPDGKRLDHLALGISALYDAGEATGNSTLTSMANKSLDFLIKYMPYTNATDHFLGFRLATNRTGGVPVIDAGQRPAETVVTDLNAIAIRALLRGYEITENETYLQTAREAIFVLLNYNWDQEKGAFFAETLEGLPYDPLDDEDVKFYKYSEIQFQMVLALEGLYEFTLDTFYIQLTIDTLDIVIAKLWDSEFGGFWKNGDRESLVYSQSWKTHLAAVQGLAVLALERVWSFGLPIISNVRVSPTNPRPTDDITFLVTATDADGIDMVYANMSIEFTNGQKNRSIV